jgi:hypothetical protein
MLLILSARSTAMVMASAAIVASTSLVALTWLLLATFSSVYIALLTVMLLWRALRLAVLYVATMLRLAMTITTWVTTLLSMLHALLCRSLLRCLLLRLIFDF